MENTTYGAYDAVDDGNGKRKYVNGNGNNGAGGQEKLYGGTESSIISLFIHRNDPTNILWQKKLFFRLDAGDIGLRMYDLILCQSRQAGLLLEWLSSI